MFCRSRPTPLDLGLDGATLLYLRWQPPFRHAPALRIEFPQDVERIVRIALEAGFGLPPDDAERVWLSYSQDACVEWVPLPEQDTAVLSVLREYTTIWRPAVEVRSWSNP